MIRNRFALALITYFFVASLTGQTAPPTPPGGGEQPAETISPEALMELRYNLLFETGLGAVRTGPETLLPADGRKTFELILSDGEPGALVNILVSDPAARVSVKVPSGEEYRPENSRYDPRDGNKPANWFTGPDRQSVFPSESGGGFTMDFSIYLFPMQGTQHALMLAGGGPGVYRVEVNPTPSGKPVEVRVALIPVVRMLSAYFSAFGELAKQQQGEVAAFWSDSPELVFENDQISLGLQLSGDFDPASIRFATKVSSRAIANDIGDGAKPSGNPSTSSSQVELSFAPAEDGQYRANLVATPIGEMEIEVTVAGRHRDGRSFSRTVAANPIVVKRRAAKLRGVSHRTPDTNGDGRWDALEVEAELEVLVPGRYTLKLTINEEGSFVQIPLEGAELMAAGIQRVVASISASRMLEFSQGDGPFVVTNIRIEREPDTGKTDWVPAGDDRYSLGLLPRTMWDRGDFYVAETLTWKAVDRLGSGKPQFIELDWPVHTAGGMCQWHATIYRPGTQNGISIAGGMALLPPGPTVLPLDAVASQLTGAGKTTWAVSPDLTCNGNELAGFPSDKTFDLEIDPAEFEDAPAGVYFVRRPAERLDVEVSHELFIPVLAVPTPYQDLKPRITRKPEGVALTIRPPAKYPGVAPEQQPSNLRLYLDAEATKASDSEISVDLEIEAAGRTARTSLRFTVVHGESIASMERANEQREDPR